MMLKIAKSDLDNTKWCDDDVISLQLRLTDEEFEEIEPLKSDMQRLKRCANILNDREALPETYKELVSSYKGYNDKQGVVNVDK